MAENWQLGGFGLYVHWPFCASKCPYCDFNSHVVAQVDQPRWAAALAQEIMRHAEMTPGRVLSSIFFGGGTPSLMLPETVGTVLDAARDGWVWSNDIEITLEANPSSVDATHFEGFAESGVNRVSLGVQALNDVDLRRLGRRHSAPEALEALAIAKGAFRRVSLDLIYARQDQSVAAWTTELSQALALGVDHLSLYQLTLEPGTAFWDRAQAGRLAGLPDDDRAADLYEITQEMCATAGFTNYEVSNHAKPGAESRHNLVYWRYGDWAGVGPGAHGRLTLNGQRRATESWAMPAKWLDAAETGNGDKSIASVSEKDAAGEYVMMGLRLSEGIDADRVRAMDPSALPDIALEDLQDMGLLWQDGPRIGMTARGRMMLNRVVERLLPSPG